jgi:hypothetical protein
VPIITGKFPNFGRSGEPPGGDDLAVRVAKIEAVLPMMATKADISDTKAAIAESKSDVIKWLAGLIFAAVALILSVTAFMLNRALPVATQIPQQPIVIQIPSQVVPQNAPAKPAAKK